MTFKSFLSNYNWKKNTTGQDANIDFEVYMNAFLKLYDTNFPVKECHIKKGHKKKHTLEGIRISVT